MEVFLHAFLISGQLTEPMK